MQAGPHSPGLWGAICGTLSSLSVYREDLRICPFLGKGANPYQKDPGTRLEDWAGFGTRTPSIFTVCLGELISSKS